MLNKSILVYIHREGFHAHVELIKGKTLGINTISHTPKGKNMHISTNMFARIFQMINIFALAKPQRSFTAYNGVEGHGVIILFYSDSTFLNHFQNFTSYSFLSSFKHEIHLILFKTFFFLFSTLEIPFILQLNKITFALFDRTRLFYFFSLFFFLFLYKGVLSFCQMDIRSKSFLLRYRSLNLGF